MSFESDKIKIESTGVQGNNVNFILTTTGFIGEFRMVFYNKSRKNARYLDLEPGDVYFVRAISDSSEVKNVTDAMLLVERYKGWILDNLKRYDKAFESF